MRGSPWIGVALGTLFLTLAAYELYSGRAFTKFSTLRRLEAPVAYWVVVGMTLALGVFVLCVSIWDLTAHG